MSKYIINGGNSLNGVINVDTSKNALLPILAGSILSSGVVQINNVVFYKDVVAMLDILKSLGVKIEVYEHTIIIDSSVINKVFIPNDLMNKLRASIFLLGPLLSKMKKAKVAYPGGCAIGIRPINIHICGLEKLGAKIEDKHGFLTCNGCEMKANSVTLPFPSVGATENLIMSAVLLSGTTKLFGVAKEPEIVDLCNFLNVLGAKIYGAGTDTIVIDGVNKLNGGEYTPIADRIIAGTYIMLPLVCGGEVEIVGAKQEHIMALVNILRNNACKLKIKSDRISVKCNGRLKGFGKIETLPFPHFPTDLQQPLSTLASICNGNTVIVENLFENRFKHITSLVKMGAKATITDRSCLIEGQKNLYGAEVLAEDLRGGVALVLAGLKAQGYTTISDIEIIDRGYNQLEQKLQLLGADIKRV